MNTTGSSMLGMTRLPSMFWVILRALMKSPRTGQVLAVTTLEYTDNSAAFRMAGFNLIELSGWN